ncbi:MAG: YraN family protein [Tannerellaceae bacterium]|jgi:putative endonuclease|nr:YraN family protein [Tannerellaceae bacterium]
MNHQNLKTGLDGEEQARQYLISIGYDILHSNWRWRRFELDIVAETDEELIFVEVKTRAASYLISPGEAVNRSKINRIVAAADMYVQKFNVEKAVRFDIITVVYQPKSVEIEHIPNAFYPPLSWKR